jgi:hypothetical protein
MLVAHEDEIQDFQFEVGKLHVMLQNATQSCIMSCVDAVGHKSDVAHKALHVVVAACALTTYELYPKP